MWKEAEDIWVVNLKRKKQTHKGKARDVKAVWEKN